MRSADLSGSKFGRLAVLERAPNIGTKTCWWCRCQCGRVVAIQTYLMTSGNTQSCGCLKQERVREGGKKNRVHGEGHGENITPEYRSWRSMRSRCLNPNVKEYPYYGGRGIKICKRWDDYRLFLKDMGRRPSIKHSLERLNVNRNYTPDNCRWATHAEQQVNRRGTMYVTYMGKKISVSKLGMKSLVGVDLFRSRIQQGWDVERALTTPKSVNWSRSPRNS